MLAPRSRRRAHVRAAGRRRARGLVGGCGGGTRQDAGEASGTFDMKVHAARASPQARRSRARAHGSAGAQHRRARGAQRRGHGRLLQLHLHHRRTRREQASGVGDRTRARARSQRRRSRARKSASPAARRRPTSTRGRSGPLAAGQTQTFVVAGRACQGRAATRSHYSVAAGLVGKGESTSELRWARRRALHASRSRRPRRAPTSIPRPARSSAAPTRPPRDAARGRRAGSGTALAPPHH